MKTSISLAIAFFHLTGCAEIVTSSGSRNDSPAESKIQTVPLDRREAARLKDIMLPLLRATDNPISKKQVRIGLIDDPNINAANAGGGEFYITTGLLKKASDEQLRGVLAHEIAHDDLGHVAKAKCLVPALTSAWFF